MNIGNYKLWGINAQEKTDPLPVKEVVTPQRYSIFGFNKDTGDNRSILDKLTGTQRYERGRELAREEYPFTNEALKTVDTVPIEKGIPRDKAAAGQYRKNGSIVRDVIATGLSPLINAIDPRLVSKIRGEQITAKDTEQTNVIGHELFHSIFSKKEFDEGAFSAAWQASKNKEKDNGILKFIDTHIESSDSYAGIPKQSIDNERFAYLGEMLGTGGLDRIPEDLRPYYKKYLKNNSGKYETRVGLVTDEDIEELKHILYGEVSNREKDKQQLESRVIINTALNRVAEKRARGENVSVADVLREPNQYQAYQGKQYSLSKAGKGNAKKLAAIDEVLGELKSGALHDDTNGAVFYVHNDDGSIKYDDTRKLYASK